MRKVLYPIIALLVAVMAWGCNPADAPSVHKLTTNVTPTEGGTISPSSGEYDAGSEVEIKAEPSENYVFDHWKGDVYAQENPQTISIQSDRSITAVFKIKEYALNVEVEGEGNVTEEVVEEKSKDYEHGTTVRLTAEPEKGWKFDRWEGDLSGSENSETIVVEEEKNVTAVFTPKEYALNVEVEGEGSVSEEVVEEKGKDYEYGTKVRLTAEPGENWVFDSWKGDLSGSENPATITVEEEKNVTAVFKLREYALTVNINGEGTVNAEPDKATYEHGEEVTLTASASEGWRFDQWEGDVTGSDTAVSFTVESDMVVTAAFITVENPLWGMGYNHNGQIAGDNTNEPDPILIAYEVESVAAGDWHTLFIDKNNVLWGLGYNFHGQLGDGTTTDRHEPVQIASDVVEVTAGEHHSLFLKTDGTLWAMGENDLGQLGDGTTTNRHQPVQIETDVQTVIAGKQHSLFVKSDGTLWGTGNNNDGQLGDTTANHESPVQIDSNVNRIAAGGRHTIFAKTDNTLWALGGNGSGQLGDGTRTSRTSPVQVASDVNIISAGKDHSLYITNDNVLWVTGNNEYGQLGDGTQENRYSPIEVTSDVIAAEGGLRHSMFIKSDGTMWTMGKNSDGQLGDGTTTHRFEPVQIDTEVEKVAAGVHHSLYIKE